MTDLTKEDIEKFCLPATDHLTYEHVRFEPLVLKVAKACHSDDKKRPVRLDFEPHDRCIDADGKPLHYLPCKGMVRVIRTVWGVNGRVDWIGKSIELFGNPEVVFGGKKTGGIQIAKMSHIDKPVTVMLKVGRGSEKPFTVQPLKVQEQSPQLTAEEVQYVEEVKAAIATATTELLDGIGEKLKNKSRAVKAAVGPFGQKRRNELRELAEQAKQESTATQETASATS